MKRRLFAALAAMCLLWSAALAETIIPEPGKEYPIQQEILDGEGLRAQLEAASPSDYADLVTALYIINAAQYGPADSYDGMKAAGDARPGVRQLCRWLDMMSFRCAREEIDGGLRLRVSDGVWIEIFSGDGDAIDRMDLVVGSVENAYGSDLRLSIDF